MNNFTKTLIINSFIMFLWWLAFNPGFYSGDSFGVIELARSGKISSESTAIWAIFVTLFSINGSHPEIATLFFSQLLGFSLSVFAHSVFKERLAMLTSGVLSMTPLVGAMGITLWHDIPMTSGFLLFTAGVLRYVKKEPFAFTFLILGVGFSTFRYNGIPTLILSLVSSAFLLKPRKMVFIALASMIGIGGLAATLDSKFSPPTSTHSDGLTNWMRYVLSCYAATFIDDEFFKRQFLGKSNREVWSSSQACTWFNDSSAFLKQDANVTEKIPSAWFALMLKEPLFVLTTHMKRHEYLNPIPFYGLPNTPFIHTTIELKGKDIYFWNSKMTEKLRIYPRIWNYFSFFFGYSGFWITIIFFLAWRKGDLNYFGVGVLGLILNSGLFIFAIIPDARFSLFVLISGQLIAIGEFTKYIMSRSIFEMRHKSFLLEV